MFGYRNDTGHDIDRIVRDAEHRIRSLAQDASHRYGTGGSTGVTEWLSHLWPATRRSGWMSRLDDAMGAGSSSWWPSRASSWWPSSSRSRWTGGMNDAYAMADRAWDSTAAMGRDAGRTVGRHPFAFLAVAVGLGVLAGMMGRR